MIEDRFIICDIAGSTGVSHRERFGAFATEPQFESDKWRAMNHVVRVAHRIHVGLVFTVCSVATTLLLGFSTAAQVWADEPKRQKAIEIQKRLTISGLGAGLFRTDLTLGDFRPGSVVNCRLRVRNSTQRHLTYDSISAGCTCLSIAPEKGEIPVDGSIEFVAKIQTPSSPSSLAQTATFTAFDREVANFSVRFVYTLNGVVGFPVSAMKIRIPKGSEENRVEIKFLADEKSPESLVELRAGKGLEDVDLEVDYDSRTAFLVVDLDAVKQKAIIGTLEIENIETGSRDVLFLNIAMEASIAVYPSRLRFFGSKPDPDTLSRIIHQEREWGWNQLADRLGLPRVVVLGLSATAGAQWPPPQNRFAWRWVPLAAKHFAKMGVIWWRHETAR